MKARLISALTLAALSLLSAKAVGYEGMQPQQAEAAQDPNYQMFARSVMYQPMTDLCVTNGHSATLTSAYQQWLMQHQGNIEMGRQGVAIMAAEQGRTMDSVMTIFLHMVEQNWAQLNEGERALKCVELEKYLTQPLPQQLLPQPLGPLSNPQS